MKKDNEEDPSIQLISLRWWVLSHARILSIIYISQSFTQKFISTFSFILWNKFLLSMIVSFSGAKRSLLISMSVHQHACQLCQFGSWEHIASQLTFWIIPISLILIVEKASNDVRHLNGEDIGREASRGERLLIDMLSHIQ